MKGSESDIRKPASLAIDADFALQTLVARGSCAPVRGFRPDRAITPYAPALFTAPLEFNANCASKQFLH